MDKSCVKQAGKIMKTGIPVKKSKKKSKGSSKTRKRQPKGMMQQPTWRPFGM